MLTNKKQPGLRLRLVLLILVVAGVAGCTPPGPRAFLDGKQLLEQGRYSLAVERLKYAASLLQTNAAVWNYLGLAYHHDDRPTDASSAYEQALRLDPDMAIAHFNLGCLLLEQNRFEEARDELTAYTLHDGNSAEGWLKLGVVQLRLGQSAAAERSFGAALNLNRHQAEAWNDLGIIHWERHRYQESLSYFNQALIEQPEYPAALLNMAVAWRAIPNGGAAALQKYREYLALQPHPPNWDEVNEAARVLDAELNPPTTPRALHTSTPAITTLVSVPRLTNTPQAKPPVVAIASTKAAPVSVPARSSQPPLRATPPPVAAPATETAQVQPEHVQLAEAPTLRLADNGGDSGGAQTTSPATPAHHSFFQRLGTGSLFHKPGTADAGVTQLPSLTMTSTGVSATEDVSTNSGVVSKTAARPAHAGGVARYTYLSPSRPSAGNRGEAEHLFAQALQAQREKRYPDAIAGYRAATKADPSFFEAQVNLGLAAYDAGDPMDALPAYETALAMKPDSFSTRFSFALALKKAGYWYDAARELERILVINSDETSAHQANVHLQLATIYADDFHQPSAARPHYQKVLELDPGNGQSTAIRYWLRDNP